MSETRRRIGNEFPPPPNLQNAKDFSFKPFLLILIRFRHDFVYQAVAVAKNAAKGIAEIQNVGSDMEPAKEGEEVEKSVDNEEVETDEDKLRKSALDKLENASEDSLFGQASNSYYWD